MKSLRAAPGLSMVPQGAARSTIQKDANGYALMQGGRGAAATPTEARERANMGAETEAATAAVASARGVGIQQARKARPVFCGMCSDSTRP